MLRPQDVDLQHGLIHIGGRDGWTPKTRQARRVPIHPRLMTVVDHRGTLTCRKDSDRGPTVTQVIGWTDFPLPRIDLWVEAGVLLLPSEH